MERPLIKDLRKQYHYNGFFLHSDGIVGTCVCMWENKRSNQIVRMLRKRGMVCMYENNGLGGTWKIQYKQRKYKWQKC